MIADSRIVPDSDRPFPKTALDSSEDAKTLSWAVLTCAKKWAKERCGQGLLEDVLAGL